MAVIFRRGSRVFWVFNLVFFAAHNALMLLNTFGWAFRRTQKLQLAAMLATLFSWVVMGAWHGFGYCLCTDWHFQIRRELGIYGGESSYTQLLLNQLPGVNVSVQAANLMTGIVMVFILLATSAVWVKRFRAARQTPETPSSVS